LVRGGLVVLEFVFILMELARNFTTTPKDLLPFELYGEAVMLTAASVIYALQQERFLFATNVDRRLQMVRTIDLPDQNHTSAQFNYALCLEDGRGVPKDEAEATQYYKLAADQNHAWAQFHYAVCVWKGRGVVKDEVEADRYYELTADQNHVSTQKRYVVCLANGRGVVKDETEPIRYYKLAADQNDVSSQFHSAEPMSTF
jgi:TPR repeat protein